MKVRFSALAERGWTRDLLVFHLDGDTLWFDMGKALAAEATPAFRADLARVNAGLPVAYRSADLRRRGWSKAMIEERLGAPDREIALNSRATRTLHLYWAPRVEEAEASGDFSRRREDAQRRSVTAAAAADKRREETFALVASLRIVLLTNRSISEVVKDAQRHYETRAERGEYKTAGGSPEFLNRITVNYLRHGCSHYEELLHKLHGEVGVRDAKIRLKLRVLDRIAQEYPTLANECERQADEG